MDTLMSEFDETQPGWKLLASVDESEQWSIDVVEVWQTPKGFAVRSAAGCSCWDGEYDVQTYATAPLLALGLFQSENQFQPSLVVSLRLLKEAFTNGLDI